MRLSLLYERTQRGQIFHVFQHLFFLRRFETTRRFFETRVIDNMAKRFLSDFAFTNVFVSVHSRTQIRFGIVEVKRENLFQANQ